MPASDSRPSLSIIIPAFNEAQRIRPTLKNYFDFFRDKNISFELLVILNGCSDQTPEIVREYSEKYPEILYRTYPEEIGLGGAVIEGFKYARGLLIFYTDADGALAPAQALKLMENIGDYDGIIGSRRLKDAQITSPPTLIRQIASYGFNLLTRLVLRLPFQDTQCGAKLFRKHLVKNLLFSLNTTDYAFDANLLYHALQRGYRIKEFPVVWTNQEGTKTNIFRHGPGMLFSIVLTRLIDYWEKRQPQYERNEENVWGEVDREPFISIVIPFKTLDRYAEGCLSKCLQLDYDHYEIILLPNESPEAGRLPDSPKIKIIPTGNVKPSAKRNLGISRSSPQSEIIAFVDSDAYPDSLWLRHSLPYFTNRMIGVLGGPNLTPKEDSNLQKASGDILSMPLATGLFAIRYMARYGFRKRQTVKEMPSCNLLIRKKVLEKIGGFDTTLLTAEDAKACFEIRKLGYHVIYAPDVQVYHHRRTLFSSHMRQIVIYARDKAWLVKEDFSSDKLYYFIPLLFFIFLAAGLLLSFNPVIQGTLWLFLLTYAGTLLAASVVKSPQRSYLIFPGTILTHAGYALGFLHGLLTRRSRR